MSSGLEGVVAAETILSHTDQKNGMVWVRGHDLPTLVARHGFEGTVALLGYTGSSNISQRQAALEGALKTYPGIKIVEDHEVDVTNPVDDSTNAVQGWLTKYPKGDLDAIWASSLVAVGAAALAFAVVDAG